MRPTPSGDFPGGVLGSSVRTDGVVLLCSAMAPVQRMRTGILVCIMLTFHIGEHLIPSRLSVHIEQPKG